jgi:hypothetical protein
MMQKEFSFYIAGFKHHDGPSIMKYLNKGDKLFLIPEPNNPHDPNAIGIHTYIDCQDFMLGYVPKAIAKEIPVHNAKATISKLNPDSEPWLAVKATIVINEEDS